MKILISGGDGQLATEYKLSDPIKDWEYFFLNKKELDIGNPNSIEAVFNEINPNVVVNLAAYTNVERAEKEDIDKAFKINAEGSKYLAIACKKLNIPLIHISTDYVFDGTKDGAYIELDKENPINHYGRTKFVGEKWIQENHDWYYIIRTSWVYSNHAKNFYTTMLNLAQERSEVNVVDDQFGSPTSTKELCRAIDTVLQDLDKSKSGIYNFTGVGKTTWKTFAEEIFYQTKVAIMVNGVSSKSWPSIVNRPTNSFLSSEKFFRVFGYYPAHWKNALKEIVSSSKIIPVKVGDYVKIEDTTFIIVSTDWLKRIAVIADLSDMTNQKELTFDMLTV